MQEQSLHIGVGVSIGIMIGAWAGSASPDKGIRGVFSAGATTGSSCSAITGASGSEGGIGNQMFQYAHRWDCNGIFKYFKERREDTAKWQRRRDLLH